MPANFDPDYDPRHPSAGGTQVAVAGAVAGQAGIDALSLPVFDLGEGTGLRAWRAIWPKLLAIGLVLVIWELIHLSGWKKFVFPGPGVTLSNLWAQAQTALLRHAIGTT